MTVQQCFILSGKFGLRVCENQEQVLPVISVQSLQPLTFAGTCVFFTLC